MGREGLSFYMQVELMSFKITLSQKGAKIIFNDWLSSVIAETIVKVTKYFENLDQFVCVDSLELDDTIVFRITTRYQ